MSPSKSITLTLYIHLPYPPAQNPFPRPTHSPIHAAPFVSQQSKPTATPRTLSSKKPITTAFSSQDTVPSPPAKTRSQSFSHRSSSKPSTTASETRIGMKWKTYATTTKTCLDSIVSGPLTTKISARKSYYYSS